MRIFAFALLASTCTTQPSPAPIGPEPPKPVHVADAAPPRPAPPPPPSTDPCTAWCDNLHRMSCPSWSSSCVRDCGNTDVVLANLHSKPLDHACGIAAQTCEAARACGAVKH